MSERPPPGGTHVNPPAPGSRWLFGPRGGIFEVDEGPAATEGYVKARPVVGDVLTAASPGTVVELRLASFGDAFRLILEGEG